jgi:LmbE family N-acetylglucosaminyl deacetylase
MKLRNPGAEIFIPDGMPAEKAFERTTHMAIAAHQDDVEIMAYHGIAQCFGQADKWFAAVIATNGAGSARSGLYASYTDENMRRVRKGEQKKAAFIGEYGALAMLDYTSAAVKGSEKDIVANDIASIIGVACPKVVYTHNLADKHDTHVETALRAIEAIRMLPEQARPEKVYGCEVWRGLDWLPDDEKVVLDVDAMQNLSAALLGVFDSQISGGKRYDLATQGRRLANATYAESHEVDKSGALTYAMDLTPLVADIDTDIAGYVKRYIDRLWDDVYSRISRLV